MMRSGTHRARTSLRRRLRTALIGGSVVVALVLGLAVTAVVAMRERQHAIIDVYFAAITEADTGYVSLLDLEAGVMGYNETGNPVSLGALERLADETTGSPAQDIAAMLEEELGPDHPALVARREALRLVQQWYSDVAEPLIARVEAEGSGSVPQDELRAGTAMFDEVQAAVQDYTGILRAERRAAVEDLRTWLNVVTAALVVLVASAVLFGVLLWVFLRRWVTDPLAALAADARTVADGDVAHAVTDSGPGEVGDVARDVEQMRAQLAWLLAEAAQARVDLETSHAVLEEQAEDLRRSNRDLEQFAYVASHDLQEPLRKVASFTQLLASRYAGQLDERADQYIGFAVDGAKRMQRLINDLLGFSRVGRIGGEVGDVDLGEALGQVLEDLAPLVEETAAVVTAENLPVVQGEGPLLVQLLANLVGNALKFRQHDQTPQVRIDSRRVGDFWEFACRDNGIGIDPRYADRVFVIFQRLHPQDVYGGTGIGLALCKKIVEYHGGDIWIDTDVTQGSAIRWTLPATAEGLRPVRDASGAAPGGREDTADGSA